MHRKRLIHTVLRMAELVGRRQGLKETLHVIVEAEPLRSIGARGVAIFLAGKDGQTLDLALHRDIPESVLHPAVLPPGAAGLAPQAARQDTVEVDEDRRLVAVPLRAGAERVGVLVIAGAQAWRPSLDQKRHLRALGSLLAMAVLRAALHDTERCLRSMIEGMKDASAAIADKLAILPEAHIRAAVLQEFRLWPSTRDEPLPEFLRTVLQTIIEHATASVGAQLGALGVGESPAHAFEPWVYTGMSKEQAATIGRSPRPVGTLGIVARESQVVRTPDVRRHPAFQGFPCGHPEITSLLAVPIRYRGANLGNLYLGNKAGAGEFSREDQDVIELFAFQAALSLQHAYFRAEIDAQRAQLQIILDSAPHGLLFVDRRSGDIVANPRAIQLLGGPGIAGAEVPHCLAQVRRPDGEALPVEQLPSSRALAGQTIRDEELVIARPDGHRLPILLSAAPVLGTDQKALGAVVTFEDISPIKELEHLREEFAAVVAHDLRDPIQGILFQVNLILRRAEGDMAHAPMSLVRGIAKNAERLGQIASDLLDTTRIELRRIALDRKWLDAPEAVRDLVERLRPAFSPHPVEVKVSGTVGPAWADPLRFDQIVTNLLDNAAKFSDGPSPITVHIRASGEGIELAVEDCGIGIPSDELARLFDRFYQARRARERKTGLGLGLYITKGLVEAHGGRFWVKTEAGKGCVFYAWFPPPSEATPP